MFSVIVVGTDGSATAGVAMTKALALAKLTGATLHVVHAHQLLSLHQSAAAAAAGMPTPDLDAVNSGITAESERVCSEAASLGAAEGVAVEVHSRPGDAAEALIAVAEEEGADLIVVGNRGMSGMRRFVLGSVPNKVSHHSPCSLLIVDTAGS